MNTNRVMISAAALLLSANAVLASDLPTHKAPPPPAPASQPVSWTGYYTGVDVGYGWGQEADNLKSITGYPLDHFSTPGVLGGVKFGYNQQFNSLVLGIETSAQFSGLSGKKSGTFSDEGNGVSSLSLRNTWQGSARLKAGYAINRLLIFVTGGLAIGDDREAFNVIDPGFRNFAGSQTKTLVGGTFGGGLEYLIDSHWSVSTELRYTDLGKASFTIPAAMSRTGTMTSFSAGLTETNFLIGLGYHF